MYDRYRKTAQDPVQLENFNEDHYLYPVVRNCVNLALQDYWLQTKVKYEFVEIEKASVLMLGGAMFYITFKAISYQKELTTFEAEVFCCADKPKVWRVRIKYPGTHWFDDKFYVPRPEKDNKLYFPGPEEGGKKESDDGGDLKLHACCITKMDDRIDYSKTTEDPKQLENFNEEHYSYPVVRNCVNLALQDYLIQTKLKYEFVEIEKASVLILGGALYYITFKAISHQKELTTFEAEVFHCIDKTKVWRVRIKNPGTDWFDGKFYVPRPDKDNKLYFPEKGSKLFLSTWRG